MGWFKLDYQKWDKIMEGFVRGIMLLSEPSAKEKERLENLDKAINEGRVHLHYHTSGCLFSLVIIILCSFGGCACYSNFMHKLAGSNIQEIENTKSNCNLPFKSNEPGTNANEYYYTQNEKASNITDCIYRGASFRVEAIVIHTLGNYVNNIVSANIAQCINSTGGKTKNNSIKNCNVVKRIPVCYIHTQVNNERKQYNKNQINAGRSTKQLCQFFNLYIHKVKFYSAIYRFIITSI